MDDAGNALEPDSAAYAKGTSPSMHSYCRHPENGSLTVGESEKRGGVEATGERGGAIEYTEASPTEVDMVDGSPSPSNRFQEFDRCLSTVGVGHRTHARVAGVLSDIFARVGE